MTATTPKRAPGDLELVRTYVNSLDVEGSAEALDSPDSLAAWLAERGHPAGPSGVSLEDLEHARAVREALREVLLSHNEDAAPDPAALATLDAAGARAPVRVRFTPGGEAGFAPAGSGLDAAIGELLAIVARAEAEGTWPRLKACAADSCRWAFYDHSRNHSRTWCTMAVCGNRAKARSYRSKHAAGSGG